MRILGTSRGATADKGQCDAMKVDKSSVDATVVAHETAVAGHVTDLVPIEGFGSLKATDVRFGQDFAYGKITVDELVKQWFAEDKLITQRS